MNKHFNIIFLAFVFMVALTITHAHAQDKGQGQHKEGDWDVIIGAITTYDPITPGVDEYEVGVLPFLDVTYKERYFLSVEKGLGAYLWKGDEGGFSAGLALNYDMGRSADDFDQGDPMYRLGDVDGSFEAQAFLETEIGPLDATLKVAQGLSDEGHDGWYVDAGLSYSHMFSKQLMISMGPSVRFASEEFQQAYYGVDADQSLRSGYQEYHPDTGIESISFGVTKRYMFNENWSLLAKLDYRHLNGDAADSPFVEDKGQFSAMAGIAYRF